jgi:rRNA maturation endonuclease Nob1
MPNRRLKIRQKVCKRCNRLFETKYKNGRICNNCRIPPFGRTKINNYKIDTHI